MSAAAAGTLERSIYYSGNRPTVTDLFCGAGGSSEGAEWAGAEVKVAANHWQKAIDVHQMNHDETRHDCADITQVDFRRYPATDILIGSPECTNHANAKGVSRKKQQADLFGQDFDIEAERSRATMWDMARAAETMAMRGKPYKAIIVENVVEAAGWTMWAAWLMAMTNPFGNVHYDYQILSHNSMHHGVPQSRDRIYVIFTLKGLKPNLELELEAWCERCEGVVACRQAFRPGKRVGKYKRQYHYCCTTCHSRVEPPTNPALSIIDWKIPMTRIGDRKKPLAKATMARIDTGIDRYWPDPFLHQAAGNVYQRPGSTCRSKALTDPIGAQTTTVQHGIVSPTDDPEGFLVQTGHTGGKGRAFEHRTTPLDQPHPTVAASDDRQSLVALPFMVQSHGKDSPSRTRSTGEPAYSQTASGTQGLVAPPDDVEGAFLIRNHGGMKDAPFMSSPIGNPVPTLTTAANQSLIVHMRNHGEAVPAATHPVNGVSAGGNHHALLVPNNTNNIPTPVTEPTGAMTTGNRMGLLAPYYGNGQAQLLTDPAMTMTTRDRAALVEVPQVARINALDCFFRMLDPAEVAMAMAFPRGYIPTDGYTKRDRVRLAGNAVTPPVMAWIIGRIIQALELAA